MAEILRQVNTPEPLKLSFDVLNKGIDNYHIDVELGKSFVSHTRQLIESEAQRAVAEKSPGGSDGMERLRETYRDIVEASLHRAKTDLRPEQFVVLQFAVSKFVIQETRSRLDEMVRHLEETLAQQKYSGSRSLLATQEKFAWLRRHFDEFFFRTSRQVMRLLHREETNHLRALRSQFLSGLMPESINVLFNPMLSARTPADPHLLTQYYALWPGGSAGFNRLNRALEAWFGRAVRQLDVLPLSARTRGPNEVYDEFRGHFALQPYLGPSVDQQDQVEETFCWLEHPGHMRLMFDETVHEQLAARLKQQGGIRARIALNSEAGKLLKVSAGARSRIASERELKQMMASWLLRDNWSTSENAILRAEEACEYIAGINTKKIAAKVDHRKADAEAVLAKLDDLVRQFQQEYRAASDEHFVRLLSDWSRYRLHLKYFRFAHRVFNRINVITDSEQARLSRSGGHLYRLVGTDEAKAAAKTEPQIVHHTILKADVRGSTTVTQELIKKGLNPASYFSLRFFDPINELLGVYGAVKVFIEGDAVILGIYEYDDNPQGWYSVSRACGIGKEMLDIVSSKNAHSKQTGLPLLEIGIGISYSNEKPLFLFDEKKPIMISPAIGDADRLSSSSWRLREGIGKNNFNVEIFEIADGGGKDEKGQEVLRYNVNGIVLDTGAFRKLQSEIALKRLAIKTGQIDETMYVGRFPDLKGKERELVVREGRAGVWRGGRVAAGVAAQTSFYEVLPNSRLAAQVLELARKRTA